MIVWALVVCTVIGLWVGSAAGHLEQDVAALKAQMSQLQTTILAMQKQLNDTEALVTGALSQPKPQPVSFTAQLSTTISSLPLHHQVVFDHVVSNIGDAYQLSDGHFVAPVFGTYAFFVTATNVPGQSVSLSLMKNGQPQAFVLAHGTAATANQWETSTMCAMLLLTEGDEVWAQNEGQFSPTESLDGYRYSSFSGFLIHQF